MEDEECELSWRVVTRSGLSAASVRCSPNACWRRPETEPVAQFYLGADIPKTSGSASGWVAKQVNAVGLKKPNLHRAAEGRDRCSDAMSDSLDEPSLE